jgi:hypothetical protein
MINDFLRTIVPTQHMGAHQADAALSRILRGGHAAGGPGFSETAPGVEHEPGTGCSLGYPREEAVMSTLA